VNYAALAVLGPLILGAALFKFRKGLG
jgi:hypothetical protein